MKDRIRKATEHVNQNEGLIFEKSAAGKFAYKLPPLDVPEADPERELGNAALWCCTELLSKQAIDAAVKAVTR